MSFNESAIKDVGTDSISGQIMSRKKYNSQYLSPSKGSSPVKLVEGASPSTPDPRITLNGQSGTFRNSTFANTQPIQSLKKGGPINKTGLYKLHKGEYVLNKKKAMAAKMNPNDSDNLREFSRESEGKKYYRMPEGRYKQEGGRYIRQEDKGGSVFHE
jgi:hypothetical protein